MGKSYEEKQLKRWWQEFKEAGFNESELARRSGISASTWQSRLRACEARLNVKRGAPVKRDIGTPDSELRASFAMYVHHEGDQTKAARQMGLSRSAFQQRLQLAEIKLGLKYEGKPPRMDGRDQQRYQDEIERLRGELRRAHRELNDGEDFRRALFGTVKKPVVIPDWSLPRVKGTTDAELPMLFVSDWQWGESISAARLGGFNEFNPRVAEERVRMMVAKTIELSFVHRGRKNYPGIYYLRGGDMISGEIHEDLRESNNLQSIPAVRDLVRVEAWAIRELKKRYGKVHVKSVPGNHGRPTEKPRSKRDAEDNFDVLSHFWLESIFSGDKDVTFDAPSSGDALFSVYGYNFCMTHGDRIGSSGGMGFLGAVATITRGMKKTFDYYATLGYIIDYLLIGHFHVGMRLEYGYSNGSLPGYSEYAKGYRLRPQAPQQYLLFVHPDYGVADEKSILLGPRPKIAQPAAAPLEELA